MDEFKFIDIRLDFLANHFYDQDILLDWISNKLGKYTQWTFGKEIGYKTGLVHFHLRVKFIRSEDLAKTALGQQFKTWLKSQYPEGYPLPKNKYFFREVKEFTASEQHYFAYCLKEQKKLTSANSFGFSKDELIELHTIGKTLYDNKMKYIKQKQLKDEKAMNVWDKLCLFLDDNFKPHDCDFMIDVDDDDNPISPIVAPFHFNKYWNALGEVTVRYYIEHEDCLVPHGIDSKMMRYSLKKKYISPSIAFSAMTKIR